MSTINNIDRRKDQASVISVAAERIQTPKGVEQLLLSPILKALRWVEWTFSELSKGASDAKRLSGYTRHIVFYFGFLGNVGEAYKATKDFFNHSYHGKWLAAAEDSTSIFASSMLAGSLVADTFEILHSEGLITLTPFQLAVAGLLNFLGSMALFVVAVKGIKTEVQNLSEGQWGTHTYQLAGGKLAAKILLLAISTFGIIGAIGGGAAINGFVVLSTGTSLLSLSIFNHFYEKMYETKEEKTLDI